MKILGIPFAVPLAVLVAFLDLIPLIGSTIGGAVVAIVAAVVGFPGKLIAWLVFLVVYQQVENNLLQPIVYRRTVQIHPLIVIVAVLVGGALLGVLGALVAIPIAATIQIVLKEWWTLRKTRLAPPPTSVAAAEAR
jgi:predicted PurR-regulated permease PerM